MSNIMVNACHALYVVVMIDLLLNGDDVLNMRAFLSFTCAGAEQLNIRCCMYDSTCIAS